MAQNIPEFLDMVDGSEFRVKYVPCPVQIIDEPNPSTADMVYSSALDGHRNGVKYVLQ